MLWFALDEKSSLEELALVEKTCRKPYLFYWIDTNKAKAI